MSKSLNDLDNRIRPLVELLLFQCDSVGIPLVIIDVLRSEEQHAENVKNGVSWAKRSKHCPQQPDGKSLAIDIAPREILNSAVYVLKRPDLYTKAQLKDAQLWFPNNVLWKRIGEIGTKLRLKWGVWFDGKNVDLGHFEWGRD